MMTRKGIKSIINVDCGLCNVKSHACKEEIIDDKVETKGYILVLMMILCGCSIFQMNLLPSRPT